MTQEQPRGEAGFCDRAQLGVERANIEWPSQSICLQSRRGTPFHSLTLDPRALAPIDGANRPLAIGSNPASQGGTVDRRPDFDWSGSARRA
jgi:hypothetical protein